MKTFISLFCFVSILCSFQILSAQDKVKVEEGIPSDYLTRNPIYDYSESQLNNTDTIPDFDIQQDKLLISGTIYQSDGTTPAKDVILYISQPNENGEYELKTEKNKRYVYHRAWIKTNADGQYKFYTFVPGKYDRAIDFKHINPVIKAPGKAEQKMDAFLFDDDPLLTKRCRTKLERIGAYSILKLEKKNGLFFATRDIVLEQKELEIR